MKNKKYIMDFLLIIIYFIYNITTNYFDINPIIDTIIDLIFFIIVIYKLYSLNKDNKK